MLITKFNKMIRNKTLWWFFAIIVSVTFVWAYSDMSSNNGGCTESKPDSAGKLLEKDVSRSELHQAMFFAVQMREFSTLPPDKIQMIRHEGWKRIASLKTAEKMGIAASEEELTNLLSQDQFFHDENGAFSKRRYIAFLESRRIDESTFAQYLREELILRKLGALLGICVWTSPVELNLRLKKITDQFTVQCAIIKEKDSKPSVSVTKEEARNYYDKNIETFRVPEKISVKYVSFPMSNHLASAQIEDKEIQEYYTNNMERFTSTTGTNPPVLTPYEKAKTEIADLLKNGKALEAAKDAAARFVETLIPGQSGKALTFEDSARKHGLAIMTSEFFSLSEDVPKIKVNRLFNRIAFDLDPLDQERYFSDAIEGEDAAYVVVANDRKKSFLPEFAAVEEEAMSMAKNIAEKEAFIKKCADARQTAVSSLKTGKTFESIMKEQRATVDTNMVFSAYDAPSLPSLNLDLNLQKIVSLTKGEVSEPMESTEGMMFVYVVDRQPGNPETMEFLKPQLTGAIDNSLATAVYDDWKEYVLGKAGFVDYSASAMKTTPADEPIEQ